MNASETRPDESVHGSERQSRGVGETFSEMTGKARDLKERYLDDAWANSREWVRRNPSKSILIAAAVGMLLGGLLTRRRR